MQACFACLGISEPPDAFRVTIPTPMMKATNFEFANRWWIFGVIFGVSFFLFAVDHQPIGVRLANALISRFHLPENSALHLVFGIGAGILVLMAILRTWGSAYL